MSSCQYKKRTSDDSVYDSDSMNRGQGEVDAQVVDVQRGKGLVSQREHGLVWKWRWWIILIILCVVLYCVYTKYDPTGLNLTQLSPKIRPNEIDIRTDNAVQDIKKLFR